MKADWGKISFLLFLLIGGLALISIDSTRGLQVNQEVTTIQPKITIRLSVYEGDIENISGIWQTSDSQPVTDGQITLSLFQNSASILTASLFTSSMDGSFTLELNYTGVLPGNYLWEMKFEKLGYQGWNIMENVVLIPHTLDVRIDTQPEVVEGEELIIVAIVKYDSVGSDRFSQPVSNIEVKFTIQLIYVSGDQATVVKIDFTNQAGVAFITLSADETKSLQEVVSIKAEIQQNEEYSAASTEITNLPIIIDSNESFMDRVLEFLENNTVLLAFMTVFFASSTIILLIKRNKIPLKQEMWPKHEK